MDENIRSYNRMAWDHQVDSDNEWTRPVSTEVVRAAREGDWSVVLTPVKAVPRTWFPAPLESLEILCLAGAGGQQAPVLAAAGARVTVYDNSPKQLAQDKLVAEREGLEITLVEGDMRELSALGDESFDLIVHPCSNCFVPDIEPVWRESHRVLRTGGSLLSGVLNPALFLFDNEKYESGALEVRHALPYSDTDSLSEDERSVFTAKKDPLCWSHSLQTQIGGQIDAGFAITGFYEDVFSLESGDALSKYMPTFVATRATKL
ncbi:MAG: class I SAM-dependent methyltransferase [Myxococcales bacterium]|nr:class I SAM-dependent methyltransferase [Myxococcales bacterium]